MTVTFSFRRASYKFWDIHTYIHTYRTDRLDRTENGLIA